MTPVSGGSGFTRALGCLLLLAFLTICLASMTGMSPTADECAYYDMGREALGGVLRSCSMQRTPVAIVNAAFASALGHASIQDGETALFLARVPTVLAGVLLGAYVMVWSRRLYGPAGMLLSGTLFAFCPNTIAHARLVTGDIPFAFFCFMSVYHLVRSLRQGRNADYLLLIASLGLAVVAKQSALLLGAILPLIVWRHVATGGETAGRLSLVRVLGAVLGCLLIVNAAYDFRFYASPEITGLSFLGPFRIHLPLPQVFLDAFYSGLIYNGRGWPAYILGLYSASGWWWYYPVLFVLKEPAAMTAMLLWRLGLGLTPREGGVAARTAGSSRNGGFERDGDSLDRFALVVSLLAILLFFMLVCRVDIGIRYLLPAYPFLFVLAGRLGEWAWTRKGALPRTGVACLCLWYAASSLSYFPHFLAYGSDFIVDRNELYRYFADSNLDWAQSDGYLERFVAEMSRTRDDVHVNPDDPVAGLVVVNANRLVDVAGLGRRRLAWLLDGFKPVGNVGYNWIVFDTARPPVNPAGRAATAAP